MGAMSETLKTKRGVGVSTVQQQAVTRGSTCHGMHAAERAAV